MNVQLLILFQMPKNHKKQVIYCVQHEFSLTPLRGDLHLKQAATLSYCKGREQTKKRGRQAKKMVVHQNCACYPVLNTDRSYATSTFILPEEQQNFIENSEKLKLEHQQRVVQYNDEKSKMLIPKPKTKYSYCSTCKFNYQDYLEVNYSKTQHIESESHKNNIKKSKITGYINELEKKYEIINRTRMISNKVFEGTSATNQTDFAVEELGRPQKRVKLAQQYQQRNNCNRAACLQTIQALNSIQTLSVPNFPMFYPNLHYPMEVYPNFPVQFNQVNHYGLPLMNNSYMYWSPYANMFNGLNPLQENGDFNPFKPVVIDLEQHGE